MESGMNQKALAIVLKILKVYCVTKKSVIVMEMDIVINLENAFVISVILAKIVIKLDVKMIV